MAIHSGAVFWATASPQPAFVLRIKPLRVLPLSRFNRAQGELQ